jgi:trans-aconitate methyltransferase
MEKLDVGCGSGIHATRMAVFNPFWKLKWTGIDLADSGIALAQKHGMNAISGDFYEFDGAGKKYQVFLFLDSLEHFFDHERVAQKIIELADKEYIIIGNIPLYKSQHGEACERDVDIAAFINFLKAANCAVVEPHVHIYGIKGYPYMFFESSNVVKDCGQWLD